MPYDGEDGSQNDIHNRAAQLNENEQRAQKPRQIIRDYF